MTRRGASGCAPAPAPRSARTPRDGEQPEQPCGGQPVEQRDELRPTGGGQPPMPRGSVRGTAPREHQEGGARKTQPACCGTALPPACAATRTATGAPRHRRLAWPSLPGPRPVSALHPAPGAEAATRSLSCRGRAGERQATGRWAGHLRGAATPAHTAGRPATNRAGQSRAGRPRGALAAAGSDPPGRPRGGAQAAARGARGRG